MQSCPPSLLNEDGTRRTAGTKANLVKALKDETQVNAFSDLPQGEMKTAVVIDVMYATRHWSFKKGETFRTIASRYWYNLLMSVTEDTQIIHLC